MLEAAGDIYGWVGATSDNTESKEAEERLKDADRRKDKFLAMLAHELRNPGPDRGGSGAPAGAECTRWASAPDESNRRPSGRTYEPTGR
ncbi:hypothetical protein AWB74_07336 [Caballeronia arvi]|uniref:histidine kinase n=2 Tax=Caballeronia arvi TaxID=1777135 RepID=A0A158KXS2_9BURK|nr:hypothetical protein AWB74_07336 [Caballeronia arvi]